MKSLLIFPPAGDLSQPPLGIAQIAGYSRKCGITTDLIDLNIDSVEYFLSTNNMKLSYERILDKIESMENANSLNKDEMKEYRCLVQSALNGDYLIHNIEDALYSIRNEEVYKSWTKYSHFASIIERSMKLISDCYYPSKWSFRGSSFSGMLTDSENIKNKITNEKENFFIPYFTDKIEIIKKYSAKIIGISINYFSQLIPGLTLANLIKKEMDNVIIVLGGSFFPIYKDRWEVFDTFIDIDIIIPYAGEEPWVNINNAFENGYSLDSIPDIVFKDQGKFKYSSGLQKDHVIKCIPDFSDFSLEKYLSPRPIVPYLLSTGCYWGKCTFCTYHLLHPNKNIKFEPKDVDSIIKDLSLLHKKHGVQNFYFVDEAIPPNIANELSEKIIHQDLSYKWFGEMRLDAVLDDSMLTKLKKGGCSLLIFGLESSVDRIQKLMKKGIQTKTASKILQNCGKNDLNTFVMFFMGFPSETKEEALSTIEFVESHKESVQYISFGTFTLFRNLEIYTNPDRYGLKIKKDTSDLAIFDHYDVAEGLKENEAKQLMIEINQRPVIRNYLEPTLISRNHLSFLPRLMDTDRNINNDSFTEENYSLKPIVNNNIVIKNLKFNILDKHYAFSDYNFSYAYNPVWQNVLDVGNYGDMLIDSCDGESTMAEVVEKFSEKNKQKSMEFYKILFDNDILRWKIL